MLTPIVHEVPRANTTRPLDLRAYATQTLQAMADLLHAGSYLSHAERSSLDYVERELRERVRFEQTIDELAVAA